MAIFEQITNRYNAVNTSQRNDLAYAELRNSRGQIFITAGLDPLPPSQQISDIPSVERALTQTEKHWESGAVTEQTTGTTK